MLESAKTLPDRAKWTFSLGFRRLLLAILCAAVAASVFWSAAHWSERRGVFDDIGYLRQAHLFQRFGLGGFDTDIRRDDDHFFSDAAAEVSALVWNDPNRPITHTFIPQRDTWVLQYPTGTGALLAVFPEGRQVAGLYISATLVVLLAACALIFRARYTLVLSACGLFGVLSVYMMVNPAKASYSAAPSLAICALLGLLTPRLFASAGAARLAAAALIGLLVGLSANLRIANILLAGGFGFGCLLELLHARFGRFKSETVLVGLGILAGVVPTLAANWINVGSPLSTTYSSVDASPPDWTFSSALYYLTNTQGILLVVGLAAAIVLHVRAPARRTRIAAQVAIVNSLINAAFFFTHQLYTPYYLMPGVMLSLWIVLAASVDAEREPLAVQGV